jgi:hypothetical protein
MEQISQVQIITGMMIVHNQTSAIEHRFMLVCISEMISIVVGCVDVLLSMNTCEKSVKASVYMFTKYESSNPMIKNSSICHLPKRR